MKSEFWHERWEANQLGFHQTEVNPLLREHWPKLCVPKGASVFVPLCGKSLDMVWLRAAGHPVVGVEISPIAIRDFFADAGIESTSAASPRMATTARDGTLVSDTVPDNMPGNAPHRTGAPLTRSSGGGVDLYCGDFFALEAAQLADVRAVYDRASLIALPPEMRMRYAKHLSKVLPETVSILLITIEYDQSRMKGPPHSVPPDEVEQLFGEAFGIECLWSSGPEEPTERFRERGVESWCENVWQLERRSAR
jgi:thiopurine S-methyltransferase